MPYKKIKLHDLNIKGRYKSLKIKAGAEYRKILEYIRKAKIERDITEETERKYIDAFAMVYNNTGKSKLADLSRKDLEKLKENLKNGKIKSRYKQPYSETSQREMSLILSNYLEWRDPKKYSDLKRWFVIKVGKKTPEILKEEEVEQLYKACKTNAERFLLAVLFDSGFRAGEFINIRFEDIIEPTQDFPYYKIDLKGEYSKTAGRVIGLYWKYSTEAVRDYLKEIDKSDLKAQVYPRNYDAIRMFLTRLGKRIFNKRVHFHMFRKSSATYYAGKLKSRQQLCYRYGWKFSSDIPDVYINRAGMKEEEVKDAILDNDLQKLRKENQELNSKIGIMEERQNEQIEEFKENLNKVITALASLQKKKQRI